MLHQSFCDPRHIVFTDHEVGPIRPEALCTESPIGTPRFPHTHHAPGGLRIESPPAFSASRLADLRQVLSYGIIHTYKRKSLMMNEQAVAGDGVRSKGADRCIGMRSFSNCTVVQLEETKPGPQFSSEKAFQLKRVEGVMMWIGAPRPESAAVRAVSG